MNKPHKHAELIKAWADGAEIEVKADVNYWLLTKAPTWYVDYEYRIKREPKPDVVKELCLICPKGNLSNAALCDPNLKLTFDGETGKLKAAEVLK
jgi:hypothetical protein